jgi:hypothetical protein
MRYLLLPVFFFTQIAAQAVPPCITFPLTGQALQGMVAVTGTSATDGFDSAEITFAYEDNTTDTWFQIASSDQPVTDGVLTTWDTSTITDGTYILHLRVQLKDGTYRDAFVTGLRVHNYTPTETATPTASATPAPSATAPTPTSIPPTDTPPPPTSTPYITPTQLPANPIILDRFDIYTGLGVGALAVATLFILFGIYARLRRS